MQVSSDAVQAGLEPPPRSDALRLMTSHGHREFQFTWSQAEICFPEFLDFNHSLGKSIQNDPGCRGVANFQRVSEIGSNRHQVGKKCRWRNVLCLNISKAPRENNCLLFEKKSISKKGLCKGDAIRPPWATGGGVSDPPWNWIGTASGKLHRGGLGPELDCLPSITIQVCSLRNLVWTIAARKHQNLSGWGAWWVFCSDLPLSFPEVLWKCQTPGIWKPSSQGQRYLDAVHQWNCAILTPLASNPGPFYICSWQTFYPMEPLTFPMWGIWNPNSQGLRKTLVGCRYSGSFWVTCKTNFLPGTQNLSSPEKWNSDVSTESLQTDASADFFLCCAFHHVCRELSALAHNFAVFEDLAASQDQFRTLGMHTTKKRVQKRNHAENGSKPDWSTGMRWLMRMCPFPSQHGRFQKSFLIWSWGLAYEVPGNWQDREVQIQSRDTNEHRDFKCSSNGNLDLWIFLLKYMLSQIQADLWAHREKLKTLAHFLFFRHCPQP